MCWGKELELRTWHGPFSFQALEFCGFMAWLWCFERSQSDRSCVKQTTSELTTTWVGSDPSVQLVELDLAF